MTTEACRGSVRVRACASHPDAYSPPPSHRSSSSTDRHHRSPIFIIIMPQTYIGDILVAVNPFRQLEIYGPTVSFPVFFFPPSFFLTLLFFFFFFFFFFPAPAAPAHLQQLDQAELGAAHLRRGGRGLPQHDQVAARPVHPGQRRERRRQDRIGQAHHPPGWPERKRGGGIEE